jgi:alkanesulfonate monooxygenase SsuD/methylene tetrahydromethanopterin reductase-like flavin-dependent oxidoreductase (luciferase family)
MTVEFGLSLLFGPPKGENEKFVEDITAAMPYMGEVMSSLWMTDHFFWDDVPTFEVWTVMTYLAALFPTMQIGPMVMGQSYRNPALTAKMAATLQVMSGGRFIMGIGAGWKEDEYRAYGYPFPEPKIRLDQLDDTLEIFTRLWNEPGQVSYTGKQYSIADAWCEPKPTPRIPIVVGGGGRRTMSLAVKYADMWNISDASLEKFNEKLVILREHCETQGRAWDSIRKTWFGRLAVGSTEAEALARGAKRNYTRDNAFIGTPDQLVEQLLAFVDVGCDYFMIDIIDSPDTDVLGMVCEDVIPRVKAGR